VSLAHVIGTQTRLLQELAAEAKLSSYQREVRRATQYIKRHILNDACPKCAAPLHSRALSGPGNTSKGGIGGSTAGQPVHYCSRCGCGFCPWCVLPIGGVGYVSFKLIISFRCQPPSRFSAISRVRYLTLQPNVVQPFCRPSLSTRSCPHVPTKTSENPTQY
jgi:hypothetical protein